MDENLENLAAEVNRELESDLTNVIEVNDEHDVDNLDQHVKNPIYSKPESFPVLTEEEKTEIDSRSIYVGNVDYESTAKELETHFTDCGPINKITILTNKFTGHPKGFAYIEFDTMESVEIAMQFDESLFRNRNIKVMPKRTNIHGISTTNRLPRRGRGRIPFRASFNGRPNTSRYRRFGTSRYSPY